MAVTLFETTCSCASVTLSSPPVVPIYIIPLPIITLAKVNIGLPIFTKLGDPVQLDCEVQETLQGGLQPLQGQLNYSPRFR